MQYPKVFLHKPTGSTFEARKSRDKFTNGWKVRATEGKDFFNFDINTNKWNPTDDRQNFNRAIWAELTWEVKSDTFLLHTIDCHPESAGLGSLMMYIAGQEAKDAGISWIQILMPAVDKHGFYRHMGAKPDLSAMSPETLQNADLKNTGAAPFGVAPGDLIQRAHSSADKKWQGL